jgi:DNA-directed RNA polymerase subunit beta'
MVEWDPAYRFSIVTEIGGTVQFKDLQEGVTLHEEVDEVGLSRHVVGDSPDEKRQPAIVIQGKASKRCLMPSRAHLMISDGDTVHPGDILAKIPRETTKTKDIWAVCRAWWNCSKPASRTRPPSSPKSMAR